MTELTFSLPVVWALIVGTAVALYVVLDGFDLGIGILFPLFAGERDRDQMMNSVAPFWDGNETWLVLGGGGLWIAFPKAFAIMVTEVGPQLALSRPGTSSLVLYLLLYWLMYQDSRRSWGEG